MFQCGQLYLKNLNSDKKIVINQGGTSSGKTYSILQVLFSIAISQKNKVITVVGQDIPNLKVGAIRDAESIVAGSQQLQSLLLKKFNNTDKTFFFKSGSIIEFKSYDNFQDAKSGKRDYLFINEANGIPYPIYSELELRTKEKTFIDYNPNAEFWVHEKLLGSNSVELLISDHRHNPFIEKSLRDKIEALKEKDYELWKVYARGLTGKIEGLILRNWSVCESIPQDATYVGSGLDFGFTNDPTAVIDVYKQDGQLWVSEQIYLQGLTNQDIANRIDKSKLYIADSAEPKSIEELKRMKVNVRPTTGKAILLGIDVLQRYHINVSRDSTNLRKELLNYKWKVNKLSGASINEPVDAYNHGIDALRYLAFTMLQTKNGDKPRFNF
jgi:phage terminase large subunit